jgi:hypothetical protein
MMRATTSALFATLLLLGAKDAVGRPDGAADPKSAELEKARAQFAKRADTAIQTLASAAGKGVGAVLDARPEQDVAALHDDAAALQPFLMAKLLLGGVLVFSFEKDRKLDVAYADGRLPKGPLASVAEFSSLVERGVAWLLVPRLSSDEDGESIHVDVYDAKSRARTSKIDIGPLATKQFSMAELCSPDPLPPRNVRILGYAAEHLGRAAGRGECADLAFEPIRADGGSTVGYAFGTEIPWKDGRPGDVVTFGTSGETGGHVVVLFRWDADRSRSTILHQNWAGKRMVVLARLADVEGSKKGQALRLWRP